MPGEKRDEYQTAIMSLFLQIARGNPKKKWPGTKIARPLKPYQNNKD